MDENENTAVIVSGLVKWFDPVKGFGFVLADEGGPDILLHANVLRNFGQGSVADGAAFVVEAVKIFAWRKRAHVDLRSNIEQAWMHSAM